MDELLAKIAAASAVPPAATSADANPPGGLSPAPSDASDEAPTGNNP